ncbi:hypothetical protein [Streptomyces violaceusniger]|uniref:Uncharacterized protein n=1 Tax=Streptomyces violaceusniger TaxID=68280 RepID=A0A4D4KMP5_STRVO|nr:hypothetical protein SVIO_000970 [Streptomyces violaceusniger]
MNVPADRHHGIPMADCHDDLLTALRHLGERGHRDPFGDFWLPQRRQGGVVRAATGTPTAAASLRRPPLQQRPIV